MTLKSTYVRLSRATRSVLKVLGLLAALDSWAAHSNRGKWVRSLLSIYDVEDLAALDVPWWTMESARVVQEHLDRNAGARVFEWGSGSSSLWLAKRAGQVLSIEHDAAWARTMERLLPGNARVVAVTPEPVLDAPVTGSQKRGFEGLDFTAYVHAIDDVPGEFDLIVVDGRAREACFDRAVERLTPDGLIVFDNVDRKRYRAAIARHRDRIEVTVSRGLTPCLPYPTRTGLIRVRGR